MCGSGSVEGRRKGGEVKGKRCEREEKRKGKGKVITLLFSVLVRFQMVLKYRNKPKEVIIFFRKKYRNRTEPYSVLFCFG